ncbi:hypothetical protein HPB51_002589 [Rhipicephalus microplus]|uniref:Uncharacterized protein n=1 Tax=Rhipicephalus microplus TaxID=6941 RepID=A0A9J6DFA4_RHIMP|nr:hypothetical protein HPB51_002589 [Rhipicephalus microplus]
MFTPNERPAAVVYWPRYSAADPQVAGSNPGCGGCISDGGGNDVENDKELSPLLADQPTFSGRTAAYGSRQERHSDDSDDAIRYFVRLDESRLGSRLKRTVVQIKRQSWLSCLLIDKVVYLGVSFVGFIIMEFFMICMSICMETILASTLEQDGNLFLGAERSLSELGMMLGSVGAGALVDVSGDSVPYYVFGGALLAVTLLVVRSRHETRDSSNTQSSISDADGNPDPNEQNPARKTLWALLLNPCFMVDVFSRALCWVTAAFNYATLEPHIAQLQGRRTGAVAERSFALICVSQALRGFGAGFIIICAYSNAMRVAVTIPLAPLSGFLVSIFGYRAASMWLFGLLSVWAFLTGSIWLVRGWQKDGKLIPPTDVDRQPYYQVHGRCTYPIIDSSQPLI